MTRKRSQVAADSAYESKRRKGTVSFNLADPVESKLYVIWQSLPNASNQVKDWLKTIRPAVAG